MEDYTIGELHSMVEWQYDNTTRLLENIGRLEGIVAEQLHTIAHLEEIVDAGVTADYRVQQVYEELFPEDKPEEETLEYRLRKRAEIRRQISTRKSVQEGASDRIADLLEEAAAFVATVRENM